MSCENRSRRLAARVVGSIAAASGAYLGYPLLRHHGIGAYELLLTDGRPHSISAVSILAYSLIFGLKHALEPDHLAAVSAIVNEQKSLA
jgi:high-affinity nickel permease